MRFIAVLIFVTTLAPISAQELLTLEDAVRQGLEQNFEVRLAQNDQLVSTNNNSVGNAGMLPTVDVVASKNYERENVDLDIQGSEGTFNISRDWAQSERTTAAATFSWTVFDGLGMFQSKQRLQALDRIGAINTQQAMQNTLASVLIAYYQIVLEEEKLAVLAANLEVSQNRLDFAKNRYEVGKGSKLDFLSAQVDLNSDQSGYIRQQELIANAKVDLNIILARDVALDFTVRGPIDFEDNLNYDSLAGVMKQLDMLRAVQDHNVAYYEFREQQAGRYPSLSLDLSYNYNQLENEAGQLRSSTTDGVAYGFTARWNIFNGFNQKRQIQNARIQHQSTLLALEELELQLQGDLRKTYNNYRNSLTLVNLEENNLSVAQENESIALVRFQLGASNALELREAQRNLVDANSRLLDARFATKLAEIELLRVSGNLIKTQL
jgi:outer membrane protein TolC